MKIHTFKRAKKLKWGHVDLGITIGSLVFAKLNTTMLQFCTCSDKCNTELDCQDKSDEYNCDYLRFGNNYAKELIPRERSGKCPELPQKAFSRLPTPTSTHPTVFSRFRFLRLVLTTFGEFDSLDFVAPESLRLA